MCRSYLFRPALNLVREFGGPHDIGLCTGRCAMESCVSQYGCDRRPCMHRMTTPALGIPKPPLLPPLQDQKPRCPQNPFRSHSHQQTQSVKMRMFIISLDVHPQQLVCSTENLEKEAESFWIMVTLHREVKHGLDAKSVWAKIEAPPHFAQPGYTMWVSDFLDRIRSVACGWRVR